MTGPTKQSLPAVRLGGLCPFRGSGVPGVIPVPHRPVRGCISAPGRSLPVVYFRCPTGQSGGWACRTVPLPPAQCPDVVRLPPGVAVVLAMPSRQQAAEGPTLHSRDTAHRGTVHFGPLCSLVTPCAGARMHSARTIRADRVSIPPQWPITGRSPVGHSFGRGSTRTVRSTVGASARHATTDTPPVTLPPEEEAASEPGRARRGDRREIAGCARRRPQGVTPPPTGRPDRQAGRDVC